MAFTIRPDGVITVDTADELREVLALRVEQQLPSTPKATPTRPSPKETLPAASVVVPTLESSRSQSDQRIAYRQFFELMATDQKQQQRLLQALLEAGRELSDDELRGRLGLKTNVELRGLLIGIARRSTNQNLERPIVTDTARSDGGKKRRYRYGLLPAFKRAMEGYRLEGGLLASA